MGNSVSLPSTSKLKRLLVVMKTKKPNYRGSKTDFFFPHTHLLFPNFSASKMCAWKICDCTSVVMEINNFWILFLSFNIESVVLYMNATVGAGLLS